MKLRTRLLMIAIAPLVFALILAGQSVWRNIDDRNAGIETTQVVDRGRKLSALIHELQRERGASALFVSSKGVAFGAELKVQRAATDQARSAAIPAMEALLQGDAGGKQALATLEKMRGDIDSQALTVERKREPRLQRLGIALRK